MKGDTRLKLTVGLAAVVALLFFLYAGREYGLARYAEARTRQGVQAVEEGDVAKAENLFEDAVRLNPGYAGAWLSLGVVSAQRGKHEKAIEAYRKAIGTTKNIEAEKSARMGLAKIYSDRSIEPPLRQLDWFSKAIEQYQVLLEIEPGNPEYHMLLGFVEFDAMNPGGGFAELKKASKLADESEHLWIHERLLGFYRGINLTADAGRESKILESFSVDGKEPLE